MLHYTLYFLLYVTLPPAQVTAYEQLDKIVKDFEPYASLWTTAADWQRWKAEWLDGPLNALQPDEVEKNFVTA